MWITPALAQSGGLTGGGFGGLMPIVLVMVIFYFLLIRPQQKRAKQHKAMLAAVTRGDKIVTNGGIEGKVTKVVDDSDTIEVEIEDDKGKTAWRRAEVLQVLTDGSFQAHITTKDDAWDDWFTWREEDKDWRRAPAKKKRELPTNSNRRKASHCRSATSSESSRSRMSRAISRGWHRPAHSSTHGRNERIVASTSSSSRTRNSSEVSAVLWPCGVATASIRKPSLCVELRESRSPIQRLFVIEPRVCSSSVSTAGSIFDQRS